MTRSFTVSDECESVKYTFEKGATEYIIEGYAKLIFPFKLKFWDGGESKLWWAGLKDKKSDKIAYCAPCLCKPIDPKLTLLLKKKNVRSFIGKDSTVFLVDFSMVLDSPHEQPLEKFEEGEDKTIFYQMRSK